MKRAAVRTALIVSMVLGAMFVAAFFAMPSALWSRAPATWRVAWQAWRHDAQVDQTLVLQGRGGVRLTSTLYLPRDRNEPLASVLIRLPYGRSRYGEATRAALLFVRHGYAVLLQDLRGTGQSGGELLPWQDAGEDGEATIDWITRQPWSNGKVGTFGCSALGETQWVLARRNHPGHTVMIASGAGGAVGSALGRYSYFGVFEGGVLQMASAFGWFAEYGGKQPGGVSPAPFDHAKVLRSLPVSGLVRRVRDDPTAFDDFVREPLDSPAWSRWGYLSASDRIQVPSLNINTWGDQTVGDALAWAEHQRLAGAVQRTVIAPGNHCDHEMSRGELERFGDLTLRNTAFDWPGLYLKWLDHWLRGRGDVLAALPAYTFYMLGEDRWLSAGSWPPPQATAQRWHLGGGRANSRGGSGHLSTVPGAAAVDEFVYDPSNPVPSRGGPLCCTGNAADKPGPAEQAEVEDRQDVLVYTSDPLQANLRLAGPIRARLTVSSDAKDTDLVARLVHVWPDGRATSIQEGALRLRYRNGFDRAQWMPGKYEAVQVLVDLRSIAYTIPRGHRLRLDITSSSFPRLERNLNTGAANNADEVRMIVATNRIHRGGSHAAYVELPVMPSTD